MEEGRRAGGPKRRLLTSILLKNSLLSLALSSQSNRGTDCKQGTEREDCCERRYGGEQAIRRRFN